MDLETKLGMFHFLRPAWLGTLLALPVIAGLLTRAAARPSALRRICDAELLEHLCEDDTPGRRRLPIAAFSAAWIATALALAGPTWQRLPQPGFEQPERVVFALDLSASMAAADLAPSRYVRARYEIDDALALLPGSETGLIVYADEPYAITPLTDDPAVVRSMLPLLEPALVPGDGARADRAIDLAVELLAKAGAGRGTIVLLTDGAGDNPTATESAAARAAEAGYDVSLIGVATADGAPIPKRNGFMRAPDGSHTISAIDDDLLAGIATGNGGYARVHPGDDDLAAVLPLQAAAADAFDLSRSLDEAGTRRSSKVEVDVWQDMGAWLVWIPLVLMAASFRRGWVASLGLPLTLALAMPMPASAASPGTAGNAEAQEAGVLSSWFSRPDQRGARAFAAGRHSEASELFDDPEWKAAASYRAGDYAGAANALAGLDDPQSTYNLGNALARAGRLEEAIAAYDQTLEATPDNEDARFNRELVTKLLEDRSSETQQQQQNSESDTQNSSGGESQEPNASDSQASDQAASQEEAQSGEQDGQRDGQQDGQPDAQQDPGQDQAQSQRQDQAQDEAQGQGQDRGQDRTPGQQPDGKDAEANAARGSEGGSKGEQSEAEQSEAGQSGVARADRAGVTGANEEPDRGDDRSTGDGEYAPVDKSQAETQGKSPGDVAGQDSAPGNAPRSATYDPVQYSEEEQALEQALARVPDDPAGLLRNRILSQYVRDRYDERDGGMKW